MLGCATKRDVLLLATYGTWTGLNSGSQLVTSLNLVKMQQCAWFHQVAMAHLSVSIIFPHCTIVYVHTICANKTLLYCQKLESKNPYRFTVHSVES